MSNITTQTRSITMPRHHKITLLLKKRKLVEMPNKLQVLFKEGTDILILIDIEGLVEIREEDTLNVHLRPTNHKVLHMLHMMDHT